MSLQLSAERIKEIDEISLDKITSDNTLKIALQYHSNISNQHLKRKKEWWNIVVKELNLDLQNNNYKVDFKNAILIECKGED